MFVSPTDFPISNCHAFLVAVNAVMHKGRGAVTTGPRKFSVMMTDPA